MKKLQARVAKAVPFCDPISYIRISTTCSPLALMVLTSGGIVGACSRLTILQGAPER